MTAVAVEHQQDAERTEALSAAARLTERQLFGIDCARCGAHLGMDGRVLGEVEDRGYLLRLWACDPECPHAPLPRRRRNAAWPPGGPPRPTRPPP